LFAGAEQAELITKVLHAMPERPRRLDPKIPRDLETIILKAVAKEPRDRYATAAALLEDLRRFLDDRPVQARRSTPVERFWRWCRRNTLLAGATITAAAAVLIVAVGAPIAAWSYRTQLNRTRRAETQVRAKLFEALFAQARVARLSRRMGQRFESLDALKRAVKTARDLNWPANRLDPLRDEAIASLALPDLRLAGPAIRRPKGLITWASDAGMSCIALRYRDGTIQVRAAGNNKEIARFRAGGDREISVLRFSPDGGYLATTHYPDRALLVWDVGRGALVLNVAGAGGPAVRFSYDSRRIAMIKGNREVLLYDLATGQPKKRWEFAAAQFLALRADGSQIAIVHLEKERSVCQIREVESGRPIRSFPLLGTAAGEIDWSHDGAMLAVPAEDRKIYLWDAATGLRRAILTGPTSGGIIPAFDPTGSLLASNAWENRLWLWDPVLGRPWLSFNAAPGANCDFSRNGRLVLSVQDELATYEVDAAREYQTLAHAGGDLVDYGCASVSGDGRVVAVGTPHGVALFDLARGTELGLLPISSARQVLFADCGELLTSGKTGLWRWPIHDTAGRSDFQIGPPRQLRSFPPGERGIAMDRSGRIIALADDHLARVLSPEGELLLGPLDDCRSVAVSPDGEWLATGSHSLGGAQVWRMRDAARVAELAVEGGAGVRFSPDGKYLMTTAAPCRLWEVGSWRQAREIDGTGYCFSADGALFVLQDSSRKIHLIETETGRSLARLESPDLCSIWSATFSSDGTRLVVTTNDGPAVHVWNLRAIRRQLAGLGLDWDWPPASGPDAALDDAAEPDALSLEVDFGPLKERVAQNQSHLEQSTVDAQELVTRNSERLKRNPADVEALHLRGHALCRLRRRDLALDDFSAAVALRPTDAHLRAWKGGCLFDLKRYALALDELEAAFRSDPETVRELTDIDLLLNNRAWELATGAEGQRRPLLAVRLAALAVALVPQEQYPLNTLGVALYRSGRVAEAIEPFEKSLKAADGRLGGYDLFFLAMAHHRLGHHRQARDCFDRGVLWMGKQDGLSEPAVRELSAFRAEAEAVLAGPAELPADVFAGAR
jgi:WD40 repeat protein/tetratricopeptide (TPR) repeat protein